MREQGRFSNIILSTLVLFCVGYTSAIKVTFGTSGGPIVPPPPPKPTEAPKPPFRDPAAVWEDLSNDVPNPNPYKPTPAPYPRIFPSTPSTTPEPSTPKPVGQKMYTHIQYNVPKPQPLEVNVPPAQPTQSNALKFVQAYLPRQPANSQQNQEPKDDLYKVHEKTDDIDNHIAPSVVPELGTKYIPAFGLTYFTPQQYYDPRKFVRYNNDEDERRYNEIHNNEIFDSQNQHSNDLALSFEKTLHRRVSKSPDREAFVPRSPYTIFPQQYFYPMNYAQH